MIIDVHTHNLLPEHWGEEHKAHWEPVYGEPYPTVTPEQYDEAMLRGGIDVAIVFGLAATQATVRTPNSFVADFCRQAKTPTIPFTSMDLSDADWREQLDEACELGFKGVKLYPVLALFDPADPQFDEFYRVITERQMVLLWHMGATPSPIGKLSLSQPLIIDEIARRHPDMKQIMAHMGHPYQREALIVLRKNRNVYSDVSASWTRPYSGYQALVGAQEWNVVDKLLFGSDFPLFDPQEALAQFRSLADLRSGNLPHVLEETVESIINQDALTLLGLPDPRQ